MQVSLVYVLGNLVTRNKLPLQVCGNWLGRCSSSSFNHNSNKILKSDWLSTVLISALMRHCNRTVRVILK